MGSKSDVSAFFWLRLGNGFGTKPAGALLFRMRSRRSFLGLCLVAAVSQWLGHDFIVFRGSKSDVSAFFWLRFHNGFGTKPAGVLLFRTHVRNSFFLSLAWWLAGFQVLRCAVPCLRQPPKATFRKFSGCGFVWFGHYTSFFLFSGFQKRRFGIFWLRFRNGFGTKPAGVLLFRMRVRNTFFLSLAWWLAGFQVLRCAVPCLRQPFATFFLCF